MDLRVNVSIPYLWGNQAFQKNDWGFLNFLVGPNGTGKTLFAEKLKDQCQSQGLKPRLLNAERLAGLEKQNYGIFGYSNMGQGFNIGQFPDYINQGMSYGLSSDAFVILKEKLDIRIRIEAGLSQLFGRRIRLAEEGGFLKPKMQKIEGGAEYGLKENECHGLKELIALLTFLYDDEYNCLIIDEPELHLHPQFQTLFLQEIRQVGGDPRTDPRKKCFFLITHSPYYVDVRTPEELRHCVVFHPDKLPTYIDRFDSEDEYRVRRLLPKLNTHHKQFFFASRPIFVEGYTDQQLFTLIEEKRGKLLGASGACIIDVGGKDELDLFFRLCKKLNIDAQFVADLDLLVLGKLRQSVSQDDRCKSYLQREGLGVDLMTPLGQVEQSIDACLRELEPALATMTIPSPHMQQLRDALAIARGIEKKRCIFLLASASIREQIESLIPGKIQELKFIQGRELKILEAFSQCNVYLLERGELENYLPGYTGNPYVVSDDTKQDVFVRERDSIMETDLDEQQVLARYDGLVTILDKATRSILVNMDLYLSYTIGDWVHKVQSAFVRGEVRDKEALIRNATVEWKTHSRIFELLEFSPDSKDSNRFTCKIKLKPLVDPKERVVVFDDQTVAANYKLN